MSSSSFFMSVSANCLSHISAGYESMSKHCNLKQSHLGNKIINPFGLSLVGHAVQVLFLVLLLKESLSVLSALRDAPIPY